MHELLTAREDAHRHDLSEPHVHLALSHLPLLRAAPQLAADPRQHALLKAVKSRICEALAKGQLHHVYCEVASRHYQP